jgi:hypothetical protein
MEQSSQPETQQRGESEIRSRHRSRPSSLGSKMLSVLVTVVLVVAAIVAARNIETSQDSAPAAQTRLSNKTGPANQAADNDTREVDQRLPRWTIPGPSGRALDKVRWIRLSDHYYGLTFIAVNRTGLNRLAERGPTIYAAYANAPGLFGAMCEAAGTIHDEPVTRKELLALDAPSERVIAPGEKVRLACVQHTHLAKADLPSGKLRIDPMTFMLLSH